MRKTTTTKRYIGCKQRLKVAVNDRLGVEPGSRNWTRSRLGDHSAKWKASLEISER